MDGSDQDLELKNSQSPNRVQRRSATEEQSCLDTTELLKAVGTFQETDEEKEGIEEFVFESVL